jgi:site-specific DNA-methyltransferase (adenine-specific)
MPVLFSSATDEWPTPQAFFDKLNRRHRFTLDAAATAGNAKCPLYFTREQDGLKQEDASGILQSALRPSYHP